MRSTQEFREVLDLYETLRGASFISVETRNAAFTAASTEFCNKAQIEPYKAIILALPPFTEEVPVALPAEVRPPPRPAPAAKRPAAPTGRRGPGKA